jgi:hypothetical protein
MTTLLIDHTEATKVEAPWYAAYPAPKRVPDSISASRFYLWLQDGKQPGNDFILVDLRRTDFEVPSQSIGPAQNMYGALTKLGRHNSWRSQPAGAKFVSHYPEPVRDRLGKQC